MIDRRTIHLFCGEQLSIERQLSGLYIGLPLQWAARDGLVKKGRGHSPGEWRVRELTEAIQGFKSRSQRQSQPGLGVVANLCLGDSPPTVDLVNIVF